ncbi:MAG TPA: alpha/beta fold hydrolase [Pirellulaceae bacterium]|nr:alpha/beta fold hydrolase [Pirellulaceae bacterium]
MHPLSRRTIERTRSACRWTLTASALTLSLFASLPSLADEQGGAVSPAPTRLPVVAPGEVGMQADTLARIDRAVEEAIEKGKLPGAVVLVARQGKIVHLKAYGDAEVLPERVPMTVDRVFDLASLTKPLATGLAVTRLIEEGKLSLDDPVAKHWPEFAAEGKEAITIRDLATHQGGLIADNSIRDYEGSREEALAKIAALKPNSKPGEKFVYSDVGAIVLGHVVERITGQRLDEYIAATLYRPLGLSVTGYLPSDELKRVAVPTERRDDAWMRGEVHDPRAFAMGGVAGHAGLFSTAEDLAVLAQGLLNEGEFGGVRIFAPESVALMTAAYETPRGVRALLWDKDSPYSSNRGSRLSPASVGHGGFTGTAFWIDPDRDLSVIFLSSRLHPDGEGSVNPLAGRIADIAVEALEPTDKTQPLSIRRRDGSVARIETEEAWRRKRQDILDRMQEAMGPLPDRSQWPDFDVQTKEEFQGDGFVRKTISIAADAGDRVPADLYLPKNKDANAKLPAMLALHPTGELGKRIVAGEGPLLNRGYAVELAQRGYVVLAPDYPSFGDYAAYDFAKDDYVSGTMKGIANHMRCVDYLQSLPQVDGERIGAIGHSLGGHNAIFLGAFDERVKAVVSSCGWTPFHDYYGGAIAGWTSDRYMPLLRDRYGLDPDRIPFDFYESVAALAPRAFFTNSPLHDANFDVAGVRKAEPRVREVYALLGAEEDVRFRYPDCGHDFPDDVRAEAFAFLDKALKRRAAEEEE